MKTTVEIPNALFREVKKIAAERKLSFKNIFYTALLLFVDSSKQNPSKKPFKLKKHPFKGRGLVDGLSHDDWPKIRALAYEGHGG